MSITITQTEITHRYLMNKGKLELWQMLAGLGDPACGLVDGQVAQVLTKDELASRIMRIIRAEQERERARPRAADDPIIGQLSFGDAWTDRHGLRWICVGWAHSDVGRAIVFVREMQPGERVGLDHPAVFASASAEAIRELFP